MKDQLNSSSSSSGHDVERLIAEHRERIISLEADGLPSDDANALWDALGEILTDMKRQQALINPAEPSDI